jgi:hypothetical protein
MEVHAAGKRTNRTRIKAGGSALFWVVLIVIIVVGVVTVGQKYFGWGSPGDPEDCPWLEEDRIVSPGGKVTLPEPPKTDLQKWSNFRVDPLYDGVPRGLLEVTISDEGFVFATWKADYKDGDMQLTFSTGFEGNVDVTKTFKDEFGNEDPSLLYLIAKGTYTKQTYNTKSTRGGAAGGEAHLTGWLGPDGHGKGKIVLSFNEKVTHLLTWER